MTPLGSAVVPEVKRISATSSLQSVGPGNGGVSALQSRSASRQVAMPAGADVSSPINRTLAFTMAAILKANSSDDR